MTRPSNRFDCIDDCVIPCTATVISRQKYPDLFAVGIGVLLEQLCCGQQDSGRTESALQRVALMESSLQVFKFSVIGQAFDCINTFPMCLDSQGQATPHNLAIEANRTGSADTVFATHVGAGESKIEAQKVSQITAYRCPF